MSRPITDLARRTYFNNPLVEASLRHLPAALEYPDTASFKRYLADQLHHNSQNTRNRMARYIAERFSTDGKVNLDLARALRKFGDSRIGREIFYFELLRATPLLQDIASLWLAEIPQDGVARLALLAFLEPRLGGRNLDTVAKSAVTAFRQCSKLTSPKVARYIPVWAEPPLEAFLYVLARLFPERTMARVDLLVGHPIVRAMLWPRPAVGGLLKEAEGLGHVSKISHLDQYHQFTLSASGRERMNLLLEDTQVPLVPADTIPPAPPKRQPLAGKKMVPIRARKTLQPELPLLLPKGRLRTGGKKK